MFRSIMDYKREAVFTMTRQTTFIAIGIAVLLALVAGILLFNAPRETPVEQTATVSGSALIRMHSMTKGNPGAPVVIVEFFDPACETCAAFYPMVKELMAANPEQIRLVLRYAPFHEGSDKVVALLEAARLQDKFWPALETLLANQAHWTQHHRADPQRAVLALSDIGLNMEALMFDMTLPRIGSVIAQDLADARTLRVSKTPEFFVNGRPLPSFGFRQLQNLVAQELAAQSTR